MQSDHSHFAAARFGGTHHLPGFVVVLRDWLDLKLVSMNLRSSCLQILSASLLFCSTGSAALMIQYQTDSLGGNLYRYTYTPGNYSFGVNQDFDIRFEAGLYSNLVNGVAPASFDLAVFEPNYPPGMSGDYDPLALVNNPPLTGTFAVSFAYLGSGTPGSQYFTVSQFDPDGKLIELISAGQTFPSLTQTDPSLSSVPEPGSLALLIAGVAALVHRRKHLRSVRH